MPQEITIAPRNADVGNQRNANGTTTSDEASRNARAGPACARYSAEQPTRVKKKRTRVLEAEAHEDYRPWIFLIAVRRSLWAQVRP